MYASTGITTDSARRKKATNWARWIAIPTRKLFAGKPMPALQVPVFEPGDLPQSATGFAAMAPIGLLHVLP
jgi:hypothetical protein